MIEIALEDGTKKKFEDGISVADALVELGGDEAGGAVAVEIGGRVLDVRQELTGDGNMRIIKGASDEGMDILRHSASHLMALAVLELYGDVKFAIGPSIKDGFYYDFLLEHAFNPEDLEKIEKKMVELRDSGPEFTREELSKEEALKLFSDLGQTFKVELINDLEADSVSIYRLGSFVDLCTGPHLPDIAMVKAFKMLSIAGAYWRGDEKNQMLQRIYGTAFFSENELEEDIERREEAKRRDHRILGPQLGLFEIFEESGGGLVSWYPKGYILREIIENFWKDEHRKNGYEMIMTPHIAKSGLWKTSGHYDYYKDNMYMIDDGGQEYVLKPMNCPGHILMYKKKLHSYRDLPVRYAELGTVYRNERTGTLHGLLRVRGFTQDDAHIFCTPDQLMDEVDGCFELAHFILTSFGFENYKVELSMHDPEHMDKYAGSEQEWEVAEQSLLSAIEKRDIPYEKIAGEAVFYGPKIDIKLIDAIGRGWQATTIQFDFNLPRCFNLEYVTSEGKREYVYMIHRALLGSLERFIGTLTEHYAGEFPLWLAPVQIVVLPVGKDHEDYATDCVQRLKDAGIRAEADLREEKLGYRIRESELNKIPYMAVAGDRELESGSLDIRSKSRGRLGAKKIDELISEMVDEVERKA